MKTSKRLGLVGMMLLVVAGLLGGCASVGFEWGKTTLTDKALVFGRMQLERDGERSTISVISTARPVPIYSSPWLAKYSS